MRSTVAGLSQDSGIDTLVIVSGRTSGVVLVAVILTSPVSSPRQRLQSAESRPRRRQSSRLPAQRRVRGLAPAQRGVTRHRPGSGPQCHADSAPLTEPCGGGRAEAPGSGECASWHPPGPHRPHPIQTLKPRVWDACSRPATQTPASRIVRCLWITSGLTRSVGDDYRQKGLPCIDVEG